MPPVRSRADGGLCRPREAKSGLPRAGGSCREPDAGGKKREAMGWRQLPRAQRGRQKAG